LNKEIIKESEILKSYLNFKLKTRVKKGIENLKLMKLLPLVINSSEEFRLFVRIFGFRLADGTIYQQKKNNSFTFALYFGTKDDAQWLCDDVKKIWKLIVKPNKFKKSNCYVVYLPSYLARLCILVGSPIGDKTLTAFKLPSWIFDLPNNLKWEFIDGLFAGDGATPRLKPNINSSKSLKIALNSEKSLAELFKNNFMKKLKILLNSLGIKTSEPKILWNEEILAKDGRITYPISLRVLTQRDNMIKFLENVNYSYCKRGNSRREIALKVLNGLDIKDELSLFIETNGEIPPSKNICVLLEKKFQYNLIESAAARFSSKNKYTQLAIFLYNKFNRLSKIKLDSIKDSYIYDWKFGRRFIPFFYLKGLAVLAKVELDYVGQFIEKVRLLKNRNEFSFPIKAGDLS